MILTSIWTIKSITVFFLPCFFQQLQRSEDVHIMVAPGTYAVTAGQWGKAQEQTHVVHVNHGNTVELDFVL